MKSSRFLALLTLCLAGTALSAPIDDRMTIIEAIEEVRATGVDIVYSTQLVGEWMLVRETPTESDPVAALRSTLAAYQLDLEPGPGGKWLVVRSDKPQVPATAPPAPQPEIAPAPGLPPIEEIIIVASRHAMFDRRGIADQFLTGDEIRLMPHIADDAFRAFHRLPGVAANDFQAPFNLRGGSADEVKMQLNGLEIFEPFHMRTLFRPLSIIDPGIIEQAQVYSGGFTADHGNYMSGVIDIVTERPDTESVHELGVSFVSAFARSKGQFADGRGSYFASGRHGYLDLITDRLVDKGEELKPRYADFYGRLSYAVSDTAELSLQALFAADDVSFVDPGDGEDFGEDSHSNYLWLTAEIEPVPGITATNLLFSGRVESEELGSQDNPPNEDIFRFFHRDAKFWGIQSDWNIALSTRHLFRFGARYRNLQADFDYQLDAVRRSNFVNNNAPFFVQRDIQTRSDGDELGAYGTYRLRVSDRQAWEFGLRWDKQTYADIDDDTQVSPRVNALFRINDRADLRVAWGEYYQPQAIQDLQVADGDLRYYGAERAEHRVIGVRYQFESGMELQVDAYDKRYREIRPRYENLLDVYEFAHESNFDRALLDPDSGRAYGVELTLRSRDQSSLNWWLSYTAAKVEDVFDGTSVLRSWDQRHALTASLTWHGEYWSLSGVARYHSSWPKTPLIVTPVTDGSGNVVGVDADLSQRNTDRFDSYSRVDLRASRRVDVSRGEFEYYFEVYNVFNADNECCTSSHDLTFGPSLLVSPHIDDYLPLFPSFGFVWRFGPGTDQ